MKPELWLVDHAPIMGGAEQLVVKIARHARQRGDVRVVIVCPPGSELARVARGAGVELRTLAMAHFAARSAPLIPLTVARLARLLRGAGRSAVPVACSAWAQALVAACAPALRERPILHLLVEQETAERASARAVLARVGLPVTLGANATATYARALARPDVVAFNNVLGDDELQAAAAAPRRLRPVPLRPGSAAPVVGALGRFIPDKGVLELVDELAAAPARGNRRSSRATSRTAPISSASARGSRGTGCRSASSWSGASTMCTRSSTASTSSSSLRPARRGSRRSSSRRWPAAAAPS